MSKIRWITGIGFALLTLTLRADPDPHLLAMTNLSATAQATLTQLAHLTALPAGSWRYHAGDLAHGESVNLNDAHWPLATLHHVTGPASVWYRREIMIPSTLNGYDLSGSRIWLRFRAGTQGPLTEIIYFNGRRVALGEELEPIILFDHAKPGDKILVAVKLPRTLYPKTLDAVDLTVEFPANRPSVAAFIDQFQTAALLGKGSQSAALIEQAIHAIDLEALHQGKQNQFDESLKKALAILQPLKNSVKAAHIYLAGNSHVDAAWQWPWTDSVDVIRRTFTSALQLMNEYPDYKYVQSAAQYNEWMAEKYPVLNAEIKQRVKEGRWEIVGGMWVEPDLNLPDGESIVRSLLIGKRWLKKEYDVNVRVGWNPDSFGYNWQMPQIYKKFGIDYFVTQKMSWNDTNPLPFKLFWWQSPDGSRVLTYFPHTYNNQDLDPVRLAVDFTQAKARLPGTTKMLDLYGVGDHGGGPTRSILDEGQTWMQANVIAPTLTFSRVDEFFASIEKDLNPDSPQWNYQRIAKGYQLPPQSYPKLTIPTWNSEMYFEYHRGVLTSQANHKRNMRERTMQLLNAEKWASLAWLQGEDYPAQPLTAAWKKMAFNDFHDLAAGSGIGVIYKDAARDYEMVRLTAKEITDQALQTLALKINTTVKTNNGVPILVFNPLAWPRSGQINLTVQLPTAATGISVVDANQHALTAALLSKDEQTHQYHLLVNISAVPSLGYKVIYAIPQTVMFKTDLKAKPNVLENSALRVVIDPQTGCMTSLFDKIAQHETLAQGSCGNELQLFNDVPKEYDAWNIDPGTLDKTLKKPRNADRVQLIEHNPLRATIRIIRTWHHSKFIQDISLSAQTKAIEVNNALDWHETHVLLKAAFPLANTAPFATYEIPYGTITRPTTHRNSWEQAQFEVPALRWADLGDSQHGMSLINESKFGYDAKDNVLRLTLLRAPVFPDPNADRGVHHFRYWLYPHAGDWQQAETVRRAYEFNYPLQAAAVSTHTGILPPEYSYVTVTPSNVVLTALKKAEDQNGLLFHFYEFAGLATNLQLSLPEGAATAQITNLLEEPQGTQLVIKNQHVTVPVKPYEIVALRVDYRHPAG